MKHPAPAPDGIAAPFFRDGAAPAGQLLLPTCTACSRHAWPPRWRCACGGAPAWQPVAGRGTVATWSIVRRAVVPALKDEVPYVVAFVTLDAGPSLMTNIVDVAPAAMRRGLRVRSRLDAVDASAIPVFEPDPEIR